MVIVILPKKEERRSIYITNKALIRKKNESFNLTFVTDNIFIL